MQYARGKSLARFAFAIFGLALIPSLTGAPETWIKLTTPHFELYTTAGEKKGREAILYFEQVRSFFLRASGSKRIAEAPVRIVAFRSEKDYKPYRMSESAVAYYAESRDREFIVMQDISVEHYPAAIHEYTHLVIQRDGLKLPVWLNEGWAELYSSLKPQGNKAIIGQLLPASVQTLAYTKWLDLDVLSKVDQTSPMYNERDKAGIFYAQSWLLVHMLYFSSDYSANFAKFVVAVANGQETAQAFQSVYGKGLKEVRRDLDRYFKRDTLYESLIDVKLEKSAENPVLSPVPAFESGLVLADLLSLVNKRDAAGEAYQQLATDNPGKPEPEEALGYLAWQAKDLVSARQHFARAYADGTTNAQMCFDYAMLKAQETPDAKDVATILQRAVELKPDYLMARLRLGVFLASQQRYSEALAQLSQVHKVNSDQAPEYFLAVAYSDLHTGQLDDARKSAEFAKKWAKTPAESAQADSILQALDASAHAGASSTVFNQVPAASAGPPARPALQTSSGNGDPDRPTLKHRTASTSEVRETAPRNPFVQSGDQMKHVEGMAQRLDCSGKSARVSVQVGKITMVFEIPDPTTVLIKHSNEVHHDFTCGVQKPFPMAVDYAVRPDPKKGTAGIVREMDF